MALQAGVFRLMQPFQPVLDDHPILAHQRHHVGYGRNGHQLQKRLHHARQLLRRPAQSGQQRVNQLERDARAAQVLIRDIGNPADSDSIPPEPAEAPHRADDDP